MTGQAKAAKFRTSSLRAYCAASSSTRSPTSTAIAATPDCAPRIAPLAAFVYSSEAWANASSSPTVTTGTERTVTKVCSCWPSTAA